MRETGIQMYQTRSGPMLALKHDRFITRSLEVYGEYCPEEWRLLKQLIKPGMTVVELGANIGTHSVDMARACAPGPFYAFEPQRRIFQILCANLALNGVGNAWAFPEACGETEGEAVLPSIDYEAPANFGGVSLGDAQLGGERVRVRTLDSMALPACHLIKIDVEGFEAQVLRGARDTIARCRPLLYVENDREERQQEVISLIASMGYRLYWHTPGLFHRNNFKGVEQDIFGAVGSLNMFCHPAERELNLVNFQPIDPDNWTAPFPSGV